MNLRLSSTHVMNMATSHDTAMSVMYLLMGLMFIFDIAMLYAHVTMHNRVKALEAELVARK